MNNFYLNFLKNSFHGRDFFFWTCRYFCKKGIVLWGSQTQIKSSQKCESTPIAILVIFEFPVFLTNEKTCSQIFTKKSEWDTNFWIDKEKFNHFRIPGPKEKVPSHKRKEILSIFCHHRFPQHSTKKKGFFIFRNFFHTCKSSTHEEGRHVDRQYSKGNSEMSLIYVLNVI